MAILHPTKDEFSALLKAEKIVVADFFATWCGPCKMIAPVLEELSRKYKDRAVVVKVDIDLEQELTESFGIMSVPTILFFQNGVENSREIGARSLEAYSQKVEAIL